MITCKYCGSSNKGVQCRYWWWRPYAAERKAAHGKAAPCDYERVRDAFDAVEAAKVRRVRNILWVLSAIIGAAGVLLFVIGTHPW